MALSDEQLELTPPQPAAVVTAVVAALDDPEDAVDPWWQAGLDEVLET